LAIATYVDAEASVIRHEPEEASILCWSVLSDKGRAAHQ